MACFPSIEVENHLFVSKASGVLKTGQGIMDLSYPLIHQTSLSFSKLRSTRDPSAEAVHSSSWQRPWNPGPIQHYWKASHPVSHLVNPSPQATHLGPSCTYLLQQIPDLHSWGLCLAGSLFPYFCSTEPCSQPSSFSAVHPYYHTSLPPGSPPRFPCLGWLSFVQTLYSLSLLWHLAKTAWH